MRSRLILKPGQGGTKKLCAEYGERLLFVRYRYDEERRKRFKTVELVVDEVDWQPRCPKMGGDTSVALRIDWQEMELRRTVKTAGGRWHPGRRLWELRYDRVVELAWRSESSEIWTSSQRSIYQWMQGQDTESKVRRTLIVTSTSILARTAIPICSADFPWDWQSN